MYETMKNLVVLLVCTTVWGQDFQYSQPLQLENRAGYSVNHGVGKSSVNVNLQSGTYSDPIQLGHQDASTELLYQGFKSPDSSGYYQLPQQYLSELATKQYLNINPSNAKPDIISQEQPQQQLYNVGYSINIANTPKLTYRLPMPKNAHSYRQQKLLNAEVITGTHKDAVEKPSYDFGSTHAQASSPNYISADFTKQYAPNFGNKQDSTKVYSDLRNGYTWKSLSPSVEISGYHGLNDGLSSDQHVQSQNFDHAAALGNSQGFDISNVVDNSNSHYQKPVQTQTYDIQTLKESSSSSLSSLPPTKITQVSQSPIETTKSHGFDTSNLKTGISQGVESSSLTDFKLPSSYSNHGGEFLNFGSGGFKNNLISGNSFDIDKSLLENFYKNYNPTFYQPEVTLPSPNLPENIKINLQESASHQLPSFNYKYPTISNYQNNIFTNPKSSNSQLMVNQHYAFVQASLDNQYQQPSDDIKPVQEPQQEDNQGQQTQQQVVVNPPNNSSPLIQKDQKIKNIHEHKKYVPPPNPIPLRQYTRPLPVYINEKNYRMKNLRPPPPMIIIHKNY